MGLAQANYPERAVTPEHISHMAKIVGAKDPGRPRTMSMVKVPFTGGGGASKPGGKGGR